METRHAEIETRIAHEGSRPRPDDAVLAKMKLEKLHLKEEMERLRRAH
ncbi:MAG: YdcH family protein [Roseococcus sp.]